MSRAPSIPAQALEKLGAIGARQEAQADRLEAIERNMSEDRREASEDRRRMLERLEAIGERLAAKDRDHETRIGKLELFQGRVGAVVTLAGSAVALLGWGIWYLVTQFWLDIVAALRRVWP